MVKKGGDPVPGEEGASVKELYEDFGHTAAALQMLKPSSPEDEYNHLLLSSMQAGSPKDLVNILQEWEAKQPPADASDQSASSKQSARKRKRSDWIMTYNRALALFSSGDAERSTQLCLEKLKPFLEEKQKVTDDFLSIACRTTFLYLEGIMALSVGSHAGLDEIDEQLSSKKLIEWLEGLNLDKEPQHKFLLALYKSRLDCIENDSSGKVDDAKIRSARKELKQAMEIFQHKLRPSGDTGSLGSSSYLEENNGYQQQTPMSPVLQAQNQAALNLKANTEQLKGNIKKSLILCSEAQAASSADDTTYDAIHANNLAIVYQTNGKRHLALHTLAKALRSKSGEVAFGQDGTARPDQMLRILYNAASCAMQAQNFISAYECMATCIRCSAVIGNRPRCWLRAAEACLGLYSKEKKTTSINHFSKIEVRGRVKAIFIRNGTRVKDDDLLSSLANIDQFGTEEDVKQVEQVPLPRARECLEIAVEMFRREEKKDPMGYLSAQLSLAYVSLEYRDFEKALSLSKSIIETGFDTENLDSISKNLVQRQLATARLYASEASCALGNAIESMKFLAGDGKSDAFDRLASELGGVTLEAAASNVKGKSRLARAQAMVRCSASAASASLGNVAAAKQLAMSAQAMEDTYSASRERSLARRALVFCMLREGNSGAALNLLRPVR